MKNKKLTIYSLIFLAIFFAFFSFARADDDEEEDYDDYEGGSKTKTETVIITPARTITKTVWKDFVVPDTDRDGLADESDPHPNIAEQLIVQDSNLDGIDDRYELQISQQNS